MKKVKYKKRVSPGIFNKVRVIKGKKKFIRMFGDSVSLTCNHDDRIKEFMNQMEQIEYHQIKRFTEENEKLIGKWAHKEVDIKSTPSIGHRITDIVRLIPVDTPPVIDIKKAGRGAVSNKQWIFNDELGGFEEI